MANGAFREGVLSPRFGPGVAHAASTILLSILVFLITLATIRWINPDGDGAAFLLGVVWVILTLLFEFGAGHFLFHRSWDYLLQDYNLARGRIWPLVLVVTLFAPFIARKVVSI